MTCREKLKNDHPELSCDEVVIILESDCPSDYKYLENPNDWCTDAPMYCGACWDREIPKETKEKKPMTTKKTKTELLEELEAANQAKADLEKQIKDLEKYKEIQDCADELKAMHTAFMNSGFSDEQAFTLLKSAMDALMPGLLQGAHL